MNSAIKRELAELKKEVQHRKDAIDVIDALDVTQHIAPVYLPLHDDIQAAAHQYYNLPGGRGSGKSSFCALEIVNGIMHDQSGESNAIVFRRTANTMRESVYSQIAWAIDVLNVNEYWRGNISPMSWTYKPTGAQIVFRGLDDSSKLKSVRARRGYFRYIWLEEFSELPGENFTRSVMQSVQRGGNSCVVFRSFNPPINASNWTNLFIQRPDDRAITLHTSYLDVPAEWLGNDFILEAERLKEINEKAYQHEYLGLATGSGGEVFPNIEVREITDDEINELQYIYAGVDFGFSVDPAVFMRVAYREKYDTVYLLDEIYKKGMSNKQLADEIKARKYDRAAPAEAYYSPFMRTVREERQLIIADSAEPKSINDLHNEGLKAIACRKYPGSVLYGVKWLQNRRIVIDPRRTPNAHREFIQYEYLTTKDGEFLADVPDRDNH
ncbi:MAG: PBSX family phage terminase large subunit, partial [Clostridia bacterium]|nr:PBSX family phage terminase large subunit [Clostridia bacterium]